MTGVIRVVSIGQGSLAMAQLPGLTGDFDGDMAQIAAMKPACVITLVTPGELADAGLTDLGTAFRNRGARWFHFPIPDYGTPDISGEKQWADQARQFKSILDGGAVSLCIVGAVAGGRA